MHPNVAKRLSAEIKHYPCVSKTNAGDKVFGAVAIIHGAVEVKNNLIRNEKGEEVVVTATVYFDKDVQIAKDDEVEIPYSYRQPIIAIRPVLRVSGELYKVGVYI